MREKTIHIEYKQWKLDVFCTYMPRGGTSLVCLHGLESNRNMFSALEELCVRRKFSTVYIDLIGFGKSSKPEDFPYDITDQAAVMDKVFEELGLQKFCLIGHGLGGMVGTLLLEPWRSSLLGFINMEGAFTLKDCEDIERFAEMSSEEYESYQASLETSPDPSAALRRQWLRTTPDYVFQKTAQSMVEWSRSEKLIPLFTASPVHKVFVYGERNAFKKDALPTNVPTAKIPDAGHYMLTDNLEATARVIDDYLS